MDDLTNKNYRQTKLQNIDMAFQTNELSHDTVIIKNKQVQFPNKTKQPADQKQTEGSN